MSALLQLKGICRSYLQGREMIPVLHDISLTVREGEYVAIMGPSGSGKSTLMNIIGCLDKPTTGSYILDGVDVLAAKDKDMAGIRLKEIGFVFQQYFLMSGETACENVELPLLYAGVSRKKGRDIAQEMLCKVGLEDRIHYRPGQLSGGQCQRVAIARAIANRPKLLLADEPTGALDSRSGSQIMDLFAQLHREGMTILMITHDANIASHAERILHIFDGRLTEQPAENAETVRTPVKDAGESGTLPEIAGIHGASAQAGVNHGTVPDGQGSLAAVNGSTGAEVPDNRQEGDGQ